MYRRDKMAYGKIKITQYHESATLVNLFIDDIDLSGYTKAIRIEMTPCKMPEVWVQLIGSVEIPENIQSMIMVEKDDMYELHEQRDTGQSGNKI